MTPTLWTQVSDVYADALDLPPAARDAFVRKTCAHSPSLCAEVLRLLNAAPPFDGFLNESPALLPPAPLPDTQTFESGASLAGRFQVLTLLGRGGMGEVYESYDNGLKVNVAIKTLRPSLLTDSAMVDRFRREVLRARQVAHPNVCGVYDLFTHHTPGGLSIPFFTMRLLRGQSLSDYLTASGPVSPTRALALVSAMAQALQAAHDVGIVHRDFKPGNVFLSENPNQSGSVFVTDFGLAGSLDAPPDAPSSAAPPNVNAAMSSLAGGTPAYMAPEQLFGLPITPAADTYALALVAVELVTGSPVFAARSALALALRKMGGDVVLPQSLNLPKFWADPIAQCLKSDPAQRLPSPLALAAALAGPVAPRPTRRLAIALSALAATWQWLSRKPDLVSLAVLPFENAGADPALLYYSDGISDELSGSLTAYPKLSLAARASANRFRTISQPLPTVARELGVSALLTGSIRRSENRLLISAQLIDGASGRQIWSKVFDRESRQVFSIQGEIVSAVASHLNVSLPAGVSNRQPTASIDAYDFFLKGRYQAGLRTQEGLRNSIALYQSATELDANFAAALTGYSEAHIILSDYGWMAPADVLSPARDSLQRALAADPDLADAHAAAGVFYGQFEWDSLSAERSFQQALLRKPSLVTAHQWYGNFLLRTGRLDEALQQATLARQLDPLSLPTLVFLGWVNYYKRDFSTALRIGAEALSKNNSYPHAHQLIALSHAASGNLQAALSASDAAVRLTADRAVALRYRALALSLLPSQAAPASSVVAELESLSSDRQAGYLAIIHAGLRNRDRMYYWLDRALALHDSSILFASIAPQFDPYRAEPRLQAALKRLGLVR